MSIYRSLVNGAAEAAKWALQHRPQLAVYSKSHLMALSYRDVQNIANHRFGLNVIAVNKNDLADAVVVVSRVRRNQTYAALVLGAGLGGLYATDTWPFNETAQEAAGDKDASGLNGKREEAQETPQPDAKPAEGAKPLEPAAPVDANPPANPDGAQAEGADKGKYTEEPEWSPFQRELLGVVEATDAEYWDITQRHLRGLSAKGREVQDSFDQAATTKAREVYQDPARKEAYKDNLQKAGEAGVEAGLAPQPDAKPAEPSKPAEGEPKN